MSRLKITLACWDYDRTRALSDGRVRPDGIDLNVVTLPVEETFFRMLRHHEFDAAEMSLSSYVISLFRPAPPFVAIPVFPSRMFRHSGIYINADAGIREPKDLIGKRVGNAEYQLTANVWIRGMLADDYGVPVHSPTYYTGGLEEPGRPEKQPLNLPAGICVERIGAARTLSSMLEAGEIEAIYSPRMPSPFRNGSPRIKRLFPDFAAVEREYFKRTQIFPIMHTVVIRRELYESNRWVAQSLLKAFTIAQRHAYEALHETAALSAMLPWLPANVEDVRREMGEDYWPYGVDRNVRALETFLRYSHEQGLSSRLLEPRQLFAPETLETFRI